MPKKKKQTRRKKVETAPASAERSAFWPILGSILMIILGLVILLGSFNERAAFAKWTFDQFRNIFGLAVYLVPVALIYWGYLKLRSEERKIPLGKLLTMLGLLFSTAGLTHVAAAKLDPATAEFTGGNGGGAGNLLGGIALSALDKVPSVILFTPLVIIFFMLTFGIPLKHLLKPFENIKRTPKEDTDLEDLTAQAADKEFKLNEGVPTVHHKQQPEPEEKPRPRLASFRNSGQSLQVNENHEALTLASDPNWVVPQLSLLNQKQDKADAGNVQHNAEMIRDTFANFNIDVEMEGANVGPRVTQYTLKPPTGVKLTKITALENNLALDLAAQTIRIEAPIPGKRAVGIEVPNVKSATVRLSSIFASKEWRDVKSPLAVAIGKDISGGAIVGDLAKMPHLLVAGQTGSGKSVMINALLTSLLYRNSPSDVKLILVDPKQVEMAPYQDIPHLLTPVINEPEKCISALKWAVAEMERRYRTLAEHKKRNIEEYNNLKKEEGMPYIVIVIDELADLMMMAARDVEALIVRIAQKARAVGIHLILATQRPSVDVITGLIKANVPARIAFTTASQVDSRTIIDQMGAEKLLGRGDMLFLTTDMPKPKRVQGALIDDGETLRVTDFIREQRMPDYNDEIISQPVQLNGKGGVVADYGGQDADDDMFKEAVRVVIEGRKASTSLLQRRLRVGYGRAARLIETMEEQGIVSSADGNRPREVLVKSLDEVFGDGPVPVGDQDPEFNQQSNRERFLVQ